MWKLNTKFWVYSCLFLSLLWGKTTIAASPKGTFKINIGNQPTTLNPFSSTDSYARSVQKYIVESLLVRDLNTYKWRPSLAKSWKISKDKMTYTFILRDNAKWHDGKPVTVEDVIFSLKAIQDPKNKYKTAHLRPYFEGIKDVKVTGKNEVTFTAKNKYFGNFGVVAEYPILPKHIYENTSKKNIRKLNKTIIGSGPYLFGKMRRGKYIILKSYNKWWGRKNDYFKNQYNFKKIMLRFIKDPIISIQRMEKGDIDLISLRAEDYMKKTNGPKWKTKLSKIKYRNIKPKGYGFVAWNLKNPLFKSKNVRKALNHLMNRKLMIDKFLFGFAERATGPWYKQSVYADPSVKAIKFNPKKALALLKKEGWKDSDGDNILDKIINGKKVAFKFTLLNPNKSFLKYLTIFKEDAKKAGVEVNIKYLEWNTFVKLLDEKKFEAITLSWGPGDVDNDPKQIWHSSSAENGGSNFISYNNPKVDKLIDDARQTFNKKERIKKMRKVYKMIAADYPYLFMFNSVDGFYGLNKRILKEKDTLNYGLGKRFWSMK